MIWLAVPPSACAFSYRTVRFLPSTIPSSARPCKNPVRQLSREPCSANCPIPTVYSPSATSGASAASSLLSSAACVVVSAALVSAAVVSAVLLPHPASAIIAAIAAAITFTLFLIIKSSLPVLVFHCFLQGQPLGRMPVPAKCFPGSYFLKVS